MKKHFFLQLIPPLAVLLILSALELACGTANVNWHNPLEDPVLELRTVRVLASLAVGSALAMAGMCFQAVLRNVLAEPFTLGISGGASVGAALAVILNLQALSALAIPSMALLGALLLLGIVIFMAGNRRSESLLLSGVIAGTAASSVLMYLVSTANRDELAGLTWWMLGDLQSVDIFMLEVTAGTVIISAIILQYFARELNAIAMGDANAWSMGVNPRFFRRFFIVTGSLLAAETVALSGIIAFAGLIVPHLVRGFYGSDHRKIVLLMMLWGGNFILLCDLLARVVHPQQELPIGVLTALVGGAVFIYLLNRKRGKIL